MKSLLAAAFFAALSPDAAEIGPRLERIQADLERDHPGVEHMTPSAFIARMAAGEDVVLLDVRKPEEFAVGRLPGAIRIDPGANAETVMAALEAAGVTSLEGRDVVAYCSVGRRSSALLSDVGPAFEAEGARTANLVGGAFGWSNAGRPFVRGEETTDAVHPYNFWWARLVENKDAITYQPE